MRVGRVEVVGAVKAVESDGVILADGTSVAPQVIIAATGFGTDLDGLVGHLGVLDEHGNPRGGFASHVGDGMFAIGYGIPPNGPLRAIRLNATPLARRSRGLPKADWSIRAGATSSVETLHGVSLAMHAETARAKSKGIQ